MKYIAVPECAACPHSDDVYETTEDTTGDGLLGVRFPKTGWHCFKADRFLGEAMPENIPDWCPLPDLAIIDLTVRTT